MADRGIIFSAPMVRALLGGRKTQTRRRLAFAPSGSGWNCDPADTPSGYRFVADAGSPSLPCAVAYAKGDRLYVREAAWIAPPGWTNSPANPMGPQRQEVAFAADDRSGYTAEAAKDYNLRLRPSIHMPRWASRLWLAVTEVRVQRLQDISEADCLAEGIDTEAVTHFGSPVKAYAALWDHLHGGESDHGWAANPWIVAVSFDVNHGNIDREADHG